MNLRKLATAGFIGHAPKARNMKAWANGPGFDASKLD